LLHLGKRTGGKAEESEGATSYRISELSISSVILSLLI